MIKNHEVSLGLTCYCYSYEIKQHFLIKLSALICFGLTIDKTCVTDVFSEISPHNTDTRMTCPLGVSINSAGSTVDYIRCVCQMEVEVECTPGEQWK